MRRTFVYGLLSILIAAAPGRAWADPGSPPVDAGFPAQAWTLIVLPSDTGDVAADTATGPQHPVPLFAPRDLLFAGGFIAGAAALAPADRWVANRLQGEASQANQFFHNASTFVRLMAVPGAEILSGSMFVVGKLGGWHPVADAGLHSLEAILVGQAITDVVKGLVGRARPYYNPDDPYNVAFGRGFGNNGDYRSFPSGHTTAAFSLAAAMAHEADEHWPQHKFLIGTVLYGGATLAGLSRMYDNKHWASDVVVGAAIGSFSGWKVVRYMHSRPDNFIDRTLLGLRVAPLPDGRTLVIVSVPVRLTQ